MVCLIWVRVNVSLVCVPTTLSTWRQTRCATTSMSRAFVLATGVSTSLPTALLFAIVRKVP